MKTTLQSIAFIICSILTSCNGDVHNGLILTDENTGRRYFLKHNLGDTYFIYGETITVSGNDTTIVFK